MFRKHEQNQMNDSSYEYVFYKLWIIQYKNLLYNTLYLYMFTKYMGNLKHKESFALLIYRTVVIHFFLASIIIAGTLM